jgi:hypothetical protein
LSTGGLVVRAVGVRLSILFGKLVGAPILGLVGGMLFALRPGGAASIKHFVLRLWLIGDGSTPWNYVRFLNHAADRILLRKVGGSYVFLHRMLMDYFAARYVDPTIMDSSRTDRPD